MTAAALHEQILSALRAHRSAEHTLARLLFRMSEDKLFLDLGYSTIRHYASRALDLEAKKTRALLQLGRALPDMPDLDRAFAEGRLGWTKAREILRVATSETEAAWVARAQELTSRELEAMVSKARLGDKPSDVVPENRTPARVRVVFEMEALDAETLRAAIAWFKTQLGEGAEVEDGAVLGAMAQRVLHDAEGDAAPTGEPYRRVVQTCLECGESHGYDCEVSDTVRAEATCDAEIVDLREGPDRGKMSRTIPLATRRAVLNRDRGRCIVPGCQCRLWLQFHHTDPFSVRPNHDEDLIVMLCTLHHRQVHEGRLGIWREADEIVMTFPNGREERVPSPRRRSVEEAAAAK